MRRGLRTRVLAATVASALSGWIGTAGAGPLPVTADLQIYLATLSPGVAGSGVASVSSSGGHLTTLALPAGLVATTGAVIPITDPAAAPLRGFQQTVMNDAGSFDRSTGRLGGVMPLFGALRVCLFTPCPVAVANLTVPLTVVGAGGAVVKPGTITITVTGAPWTTGTVMLPFGIGGPDTIMGYAHGPASGTSSTAQPGGSVQLVTPFTFSTSTQADGPLRGFAALTLRFVPEPASLCLLLVGILALSMRGWSGRP
jgi:hypothetical protein